MRGKRSKQYRKLMQQFNLHFGFREPYQVLVDAAILEDAFRFKMDFASMLEKTLHGKVKIMITQCSMRHLYDAQPKNETIITHAKGFERRRCGHHELEKPLSTIECFQSIVDPKDNKSNKHRYVVATQDADVRTYLRSIPGVPLIYLKRSVMIMEPMAGSSERIRDEDEKQKLRSGLKAARGTKRAREAESPDSEDQGVLAGNADANGASRDDKSKEPPKKKKRGPKGPNPLSMKKKSKPSQTPSQQRLDKSQKDEDSKSKRRRRHKSGKENDDNKAEAVETAAS